MKYLILMLLSFNLFAIDKETSLASQNSLITPQEIEEQEKVDREKAILMKKQVRDRIKELREKYLKKDK
jgi:hypothetical protein